MAATPVSFRFFCTGLSQVAPKASSDQPDLENGRWRRLEESLRFCDGAAAMAWRTFEVISCPGLLRYMIVFRLVAGRKHHGSWLSA